MSTLLKFVSINTLLCIFGLHSPIFSSEVKNSIFLKDNQNVDLIASSNNVKTVITKGFGSTVDEASQNALKNALIQVVGSFIDSETLFTKEKEINNGIVELSKTLKKDTQDYSRGSVKYFEILNTEEKNGIFIVEAKVEVIEEEFTRFIKKFAFAESSFPGAEISSVIETNINNKQSKAELIANKIIQPLTEGTVYDMKIGDWQFINDWRNFCSENFYYQNLLGGCGNFENNNVILATLEISINKNFLENAENIFEKTKSSTFNLYNNGGFHAISALGKNNDLPIAINNQTSSKIYVFKDIKNKIGINKAYSANSHPLFFVDSNQLKRYKVGVSRYGAPTISLLNANKKEIFKYKCNVYECPYSQNVKFIPISSVIIPQFSLFGCGDVGSGCVPTVIPKAKYLVMLNFSTESLKTIKDIKVEYQKPTQY